MKRLCLGVLVFLQALLIPQAQKRSDEIQPHSPRILALDCYNTKGEGLISLDVSGCTALKELSVRMVDTLKMRGMSMDIIDLFSALDVSLPKIKVLDVSGCTSLKTLYCVYCQLSSLDVSGCTALTNLHFDGNPLERLDVSGCTALTRLDCIGDDDNGGQLIRLDATGCTALMELNCSNNRLGSLDATGCTALMELNCSNNLLSSLDVSEYTALTDLDCSNNRLGSLDVNSNTALERLSCGGNQLRSLDVSKNMLLTYLNCSYNRIPLSILDKVYSQNSNLRISAESQSDSITMLVNQPFDLSSERLLRQTLTTFELTDPYDRELASDLWTENRFVFQFHELINYKLKLDNKSIGDFTWHISVEEGMPEQHFTVQVGANNPGWGTVTLSGNGIYEEKTEVTITATANDGYHFVNWTKKDGSVFATEAVHTFAVSENLDLTGNFAKLPGVANESRGENDFYVYVQDHTIYLSAERGMVQVYNAAGVCIYGGHATAIPVRNGGFYIVRVGEYVYKVMVR